MNYFTKFTSGVSLVIITLVLSIPSFASPRITYYDALINSVEDGANIQRAKLLAMANNQPQYILLPGNIKIDVLGVEDGKVVYGVITNFAHPLIGSATMFYEEIVAKYNLSEGKIYYGNGTLIDNTNGLYDPQISDRGNGPFLLIPDASADRIVMVDAQTGDVVDPFFFPASTINFSTPKIALLTEQTTFVVSDQISDGVWEYDTTGAFINIFAPIGGVNTAIIDNARGMAYRQNGNLLVAIGGGGNDDTVQEFDTSGANVGTFINNAVISSPFNIGYRSNDIIISCGAGTSKLHRFDFNGTFISSITGSYNLLQQLYVHPGDSFAVASLTGGTAGIVTFDSAGTQQQVLNGVTTNYGVYLLGNGNYLTTNPSGLHEINSTTGALVRTIMAMGGQYISYYDPDKLVGVTNQTSTIANSYKLHTNYPNPFNPSTTIRYEIPVTGFVTLKVYNSLGKEVASLVNESQNTGVYEYTFDGGNLSSGIYYYTLTSGDYKETKKMALIK